MSEDQRLFHELEAMQELGILGDDLNKVYTQMLQEKKDEELTELINENKPVINDENQMVVGDYYKEEGEEK